MFAFGSVYEKSLHQLQRDSIVYHMHDRLHANKGHIGCGCRGLNSVQASVAQLSALKEQMEGAQAALRKVETSSSRAADDQIDSKA